MLGGIIAAVLGVGASLTGVLSFLGFGSEGPAAPARPSGTTLEAMFEAQRQGIVNDAAADGATVVRTWSGDLQVGPGPSRQILAAVLRPGDGRSDELIIRNIARDREVFRFWPAVDGLQFTGIEALDLDGDGRQELTGAFAAPGIPAEGDVDPTVGEHGRWRYEDPVAREQARQCDGIRLCRALYPVAIVQQAGRDEFSLAPLLTYRPEQMLLPRRDVPDQPLSVKSGNGVALEATYPGSVMRAKLFAEWYAYRRPVDLRPVGSKNALLAFGAPDYAFIRLDGSSRAIATLHVLRRHVVPRGVATVNRAHAPELAFELSAEPAEQPDLVQLNVARLPEPLWPSASGRPCHVYASRGDQVGLAVPVSTRRAPEAGALIRGKLDRFNCDSLPSDIVVGYPEADILRYPRRLNGGSPVARLCRASARAKTPLARVLATGRMAGRDSTVAAGWAAERSAEITEDVVRAIELQPRAIVPMTPGVYRDVAGRLIKTYRTYAVSVVSDDSAHNRALRTAVADAAHYQPAWDALAQRSGQQAC